jgi:Fe-S cluster biogenesis protein NfuA
MDQRRSRKELDQKMERVASLVSALESCPDSDVRDAGRELVSTLLEFHSDAIQRILDQIEQSTATDPRFIETMAEDPLIQGVLLLHGLHPLDVQARVQKALESVRPSLRSHRGDVELISLDESGVRLKLIGTCNGCPSSATTFRNLLESAINDLAPEVEKIEVDGMVNGREEERGVAA